MANAVLNQLARYLENKIKSSLKDQKHVATGKLLDSIKVVVGDGLDEIVGYQDSSGKYVDRGRKAGGKKVPIFVLEQWIKTKGIASNDKEVRGIAFAIQTNIHKKGIPSQKYVNWTQGNGLKRTGFLSDVLKEENNYILKEIQRAFTTEFNIIIDNATKKFN